MPANMVSLIYMNTHTGECTTDQKAVASWYFAGENSKVVGYTTFEWDGFELKEVWH